MLMRTAIFGALMALTVTAAAGEDYPHSANYFLPGCKSQDAPPNVTVDEAWKRGLCAGAVYGITYLILEARLARDSPHQEVRDELRWFCADIPRAATNGQIIRVIVAYIEARPSRLHESFSVLAIEALRDAWPCRN